MLQCCPCCANRMSESFTLPYSGLGKSVFNAVFTMQACANCGLVFNSQLHDIDLERFYATEGFYRDLEHFAVTHPANVARYTLFRNLVLNHSTESPKVADIGCGRGGFVNFLNTQGGVRAWGVDFGASTLPAQSADEHIFFDGTATSIPLPPNSMDALTYFHVLEHVPDLDGACAQAHHTLKDGGLLLIEVPDAERYDTVEGPNVHWYASREHVYHFTGLALQRLLERQGFIVEEIMKPTLPMASFTCCSLLVLARKVPATPHGVPQFFEQMKHRLRHRADELREQCTHYDIIVVWGLGSVFFALMPYLYDAIKDKLILVDGSPNKQGLSYKETLVHAPTDVAPADNRLCIAGSTISRESIKRAALQHGWKAENIEPIC